MTIRKEDAKTAKQALLRTRYFSEKHCTKYESILNMFIKRQNYEFSKCKVVMFRHNRNANNMLSKFLAYGSNVVNAKLTDMATVACAFATPNTWANGHKLRNYISLIYIYVDFLRFQICNLFCIKFSNLDLS